jgi:uncharacterized membrane protein
MLFLDAFRGLALVAMVLNHTARWWMDGSMGWGRYRLVYLTLTIAAPIFLFLVGFCLPLSVSRATSSTSGFRVVTKLWRRGIGVVLGGYLLNLVFFPREPLLSGGVLQTIGFMIILLAPVAFLVRAGWPRDGLVVVAVALYVLFSLAFPAVREWVATHPGLSLVLFFDFAPWPWISIALIGLALGWRWMEAVDRGPAACQRYMLVAGTAAVACVALFFAWMLGTGATEVWALRRDFILNHHWVPRGVSNFWIFGVVLGLLAALYFVVEVGKVRLPWLVLLGQTALVLYFLHHAVVLTLVHEVLGVTFRQWWLYWLANAALMVFLVGLGRLWQVLRKTMRTRGMLRAAPG